MRSHVSFTQIALTACALLAAGMARADRVLLAPRGSILHPQTLRMTVLALADDSTDGLAWVGIGPLVADLDLEWEAEGYDLRNSRLGSVGVQYLLTTEAFSDLAPVMSIGLRDIASTGPYGRSAYLAATQRVNLSAAQEKVVREMRAHFGYGTGTMGGLYGALEAQTAFGFALQVEVFSRRLSYGLVVPVCSGFNLRAVSLNGETFLGATLQLSR